MPTLFGLIVRFAGSALLAIASALASTAQAATYRLHDIASVYPIAYATGYGVNSANQVVGTVFHPSGFFSFGVVGDTTASAFAIGPGAPLNTATGLNDARDVVGSYYSNDERRWFGYRWNATTNLFSQLAPADNARDAFPQAINNTGTVVGWSGVGADQRATVYSPANIVGNLGALESGLPSLASAINAGGTIVGEATTSLGRRGFAIANGVMVDLGLPNQATQLGATGINDAGAIVGWTITPSGQQGFVYSGGAFSLLSALTGATTSTAYGINSHGDVVGTSGDQGFISFGGGTPLALTDLLDASGQGWQVIEARAINNRGAIAGTAIDLSTGILRAVLLERVAAQSVPEPGTLALLVLLCAGFSRFSRKRAA